MKESKLISLVDKAIIKEQWVEICAKVVQDAIYEGKNISETIGYLSSKFELKIK